MRLHLVLVTACLLFAQTAAADGPLKKAKDVVDPDCTVAKAAKGAAQRATVGVGNRCTVAETARDVTGLDDRERREREGLRSRNDN